MKVKNKGRIGVKTPLSHTQRRLADREGYEKGFEAGKRFVLSRVEESKSLRGLKKELGL